MQNLEDGRERGSRNKRTGSAQREVDHARTALPPARNVPADSRMRWRFRPAGYYSRGKRWSRRRQWLVVRSMHRFGACDQRRLGAVLHSSERMWLRIPRRDRVRSSRPARHAERRLPTARTGPDVWACGLLHDERHVRYRLHAAGSELGLRRPHEVPAPKGSALHVSRATCTPDPCRRTCSLADMA